MTIYFTSDPHLGHKNIHKLRDVASPEENVRLFFEEARRKLHKRCLIYFLGDVMFDIKYLEMIKALPGRKKLIKGNHDELLTLENIKDVFESVDGIIKYKKFWLTHAPMHPDELRNKVNIHGHVHYATIPDKRYVNICPEETGQYFITLEEIRERIL